MPELLRLERVSRHFSGLQALRDVTLSVDRGEVLGLIGPNGAGKTTALKAILGLATFEGKLSVLGFDPYRERDKLMEQVCFIADVAVLPRWIKVWQVIDVVEGLHPSFNREKCMASLGQTKISQNQKVKQLSKGMVAQLHLALVMAIDVKLLVLDEPTLGLDILYRKQFYTNLLNDYFDEERTIVITTHQVEEVEHILTDLLFIQDGKIVLDSTMEDVRNKYAELMTTPDNVEAARQLGPKAEHVVFGKHIFLYENVSRDHLHALGEVRTPSVADLFVATMSGVTS